MKAGNLGKKEYDKKRYPEKRDKLLAQNKAYRKTKIGKKNNLNIISNLNKKYPEKYRARYMLRNAVSQGKIIKPELCAKNALENCEGKIEAHHLDYSKPLDVIWLCRKHHAITENRRAFL